jgi:hypothetical protein
LSQSVNGTNVESASSSSSSSSASFSAAKVAAIAGTLLRIGTSDGDALVRAVAAGALAALSRSHVGVVIAHVLSPLMAMVPFLAEATVAATTAMADGAASSESVEANGTRVWFVSATSFFKGMQIGFDDVAMCLSCFYMYRFSLCLSLPRALKMLFSPSFPRSRHSALCAPVRASGCLRRGASAHHALTDCDHVSLSRHRLHVLRVVVIVIVIVVSAAVHFDARLDCRLTGRGIFLFFGQPGCML